MEYTTKDYIEAMQRELKLRSTTYPKILKSKEKEFRVQAESIFTPYSTHVAEHVEMQLAPISDAMLIQCDLLNLCISLYKGRTVNNEEALGIYAELERELIMRKRCYSLFVWRKKMTKETANEEKEIWTALCKHFKSTYL